MASPASPTPAGGFPPPPGSTPGGFPAPPPPTRSAVWRTRGRKLKKVRPWHIVRFFKNPARPLWVRVVTGVLMLLVLLLASIPASMRLYRDNGRPWGWDLVVSFWGDVVGAVGRAIYVPVQVYWTHSPGVPDWAHLPLRVGGVVLAVLALVFIWRINGRMWTRLGLLLLLAATLMAGVTHDWVSPTLAYQKFSASTKIVVGEGTLPDGSTYQVEENAPPTADGLKKSAAVLYSRYLAGPKAKGYDPQGKLKYCRIYDTLADIDETVSRESLAKRCPEFAQKPAAARGDPNRSPTGYALTA